MPCAALCLLMLCRVRQRRCTLEFPTKMIITTGSNEEDKGHQEKESKEESILAMLGIIGTILNLIVIIFVYIYTTL
ncbi:protein TUNAR [Rhinophrynus dorsalis]